MELDQELANYLQEMYDNDVNVCSSVAKSKTNDESLSSTTDTVKYLAAKVDTSKQQLLAVVRRNAQLNRVLSIWQREIKEKPASACYVVRVKFTLAKEFFALTFLALVQSYFLIKDLWIQCEFRACGEIVAASMAQGGPAPSFLHASGYDLMVNTS